MENIKREKITSNLITVSRKTIEDVVEEIQKDRTALVIELGKNKNESGNYDITQNLKYLADDMESWADVLNELTYYHWVFATKKHRKDTDE